MTSEKQQEGLPEKPKRQRKEKPPAVIHIPAPTKKPWELSEQEVDLVRNHIAKGATNEELTFCLGVARRYKLDPFRGQIWFVKRADRNMDKKDPITKKWVKGYRWIPIVGINGLLHIAARDHKKHFGSISKVTFGPMIEVEWTEGYWGKDERGDAQWVTKAKHKIKVPEFAEVEAYKKGDDRPTVGQVFWEEIYPNVDNAPLVRQMPRLMLGKCATAQAVRKAYPATDGLYVQEEFMVEQYEPSEQAKLSEAKIGTLEEKVAHFQRLNGGKLPSEEQCGLLEQGRTAEEILLQASMPKPEPKVAVMPSQAQPEANKEVQADIWPKRQREVGEDL